MTDLEKRILQLLDEHMEGLTARQMRPLARTRDVNVVEAVRNLHALGKIHIGSWYRKHDSGKWSAVWMLGCAEDAPTPPKSPRMQRRRQKAPSESRRWGALTRHLETIWKGNCHVS